MPSSPVLFVFSSQFLGVNALQVHSEAYSLRLPLRPAPPAAGAMLYIVGLGLGDERDITVRGLDAVRSCSKIYMEAYTSLLSLGLDPAALANLVSLPSLGRPRPTTCSSKCSRGTFGAVAHKRPRFLVCASRRSCTGRR